MPTQAQKDSALQQYLAAGYALFDLIGVDGQALPPASQTISVFTANVSSVVMGDPVILTWATSNTTAVFINGAAVAQSGSLTTNPAFTTTYTLLARGTAPDVTRSLTVAVVAIPPGGGAGPALTAALDFGGGAIAHYAQTGAIDIGTFDGEFVHQRCFLSVDPHFPDWKVMFRPDVNGLRDEVVVEYGRAVGGATTNRMTSFGVTISRDGAPIHTETVAVHFLLARWRWQSAVRPVVRTPATLMARKWIPKFSASAMFGLAAGGPGAVAWPGPMANISEFQNGMGAAGDNLQIGLATEWAADYAINGTANSLTTIRTEGEWYGNAAMHIREDDGRMLDIRGRYFAGSNVGGGGDNVNYGVAIPPESDHRYIAIEAAHWYSCPNMGWLLFDDPYYLEELQFGVNWRILFNSFHRVTEGLQGLLYPGEIRAEAWGLRDLGLLACSTPLATPRWLLPRASWQGYLADNLTLAQRWKASPAKAQTIFRAWPRFDTCDPWMTAWLNATIGQLVLQGHAGWRDIFDWSLAYALAQTNGTSGWNKQLPAHYDWRPLKIDLPFATRPTDTSLDANTCTSWADAYAYLKAGCPIAGVPRFTPFSDAGWDGHTIMSTNNSYCLHVRAELAVGVSVTTAGAQASYDYLDAGIAAKVISDAWTGQARFAVAPDDGLPPVVPPDSSALATFVAGMTPGTWSEFTSNNIDSVFITSDGSGGNTRFIFTNSMPWNVKTNRICVDGGDHGGKSAYCEYDVASNTWTKLNESIITHGYQHVAVNPTTGDVYVRALKLDPANPPNYLPNQIWRLDGTVAGVPVAPMNYNISQLPTVALMWWPGTWPGAGAQGVLTVYIGEYGTIAAFDPLANAWRPLLTGVLPGQTGYYHNVSAYSERFHCMVYGGGNPSTGNPVDKQVWRLNSDLTTTRMPDAPHTVGIAHGMNMVTGPDGYIYFMGFGEFWKLDPSGAGAWTQFAAPPVLDPAVGACVMSSGTPYGLVYVDAVSGRTPKATRMFVYKVL